MHQMVALHVGGEEVSGLVRRLLASEEFFVTLEDGMYGTLQFLENVEGHVGGEEVSGLVRRLLASEVFFVALENYSNWGSEFLLYAEKHAPEQVEAIRTRLQSRRT